jgi:hypothetical protein
MKNELLKLDSQKIGELVVNIDQFTEKAISTIDKVVERLPKNLQELDVLQGDTTEKQVMEIYGKIDDKAKSLKKERLEFTRIFDDYKKRFTEPEKLVSEKLSEIKTFAENWNAEKIRRKRLEDEKLEAERLKRQRESEMYNQMINHYFNLSMIAFREMKQKTENAFYNCDTAEKLDAIVGRLKNNLSEEKIRANFQKQRDLNVFEIDGVQDLMKIKEAMPKIVENEEKYVQEYYKLISDLISFYPSQLEKIKNQNEAEKKAEAERLKKKQEEDDARMVAELVAKAEAEAQAKALENLNAELMTAEPSVEVSKNASVKLKYDPQNHAELLKVIQWYIHNEYASEDFETLFTRLSFMRTSADRALNDVGEVITGVPTKEDVRVRKSRS